MANDTDPDGGTKTITSVTQPANGTVAVAADSLRLTYTPSANYCNTDPPASTDDFTYTLNGGSTATVAVTVTCVDDPPTAVDDTATVTGNSGPNPIDVLANDTDPDGGPKTIASVTEPAHGSVAITGGGTGLTYQPDRRLLQPGRPDRRLHLHPHTGGSTATVAITVDCSTPPTAVDDTETVAEDSGATAIDVFANDTDPDGGDMTIASIDPAGQRHGGGRRRQPLATYTPNAELLQQRPAARPTTSPTP